MSVIDILAERNRFRDMNPYFKLAMGIAVLIAGLVFDKMAFSWIQILGCLLLLVWGAGIPLGRYLNLFRIPLAFLVLTCVILSISWSDRADGFYLFLYTGSRYIGVTAEGLMYGIHVFLRSLGGISATFSMALTTPIRQWIQVANGLKLPPILVEMMLLMYRFISLFFEMKGDLEVALQLKGGSNGWFGLIQNSSRVAGRLFQRMFQSANDWYISLELKLFDGRFY